ncbi:IclR family transcriptional regulator [Halorussus halophilus]|uniref:IclR family transcriptional regulator n=1 Tax=Halorussus halophilus TaxID=2650975 RepID=UPI001301255D|nr:IclR family transcriptional regulator [Halorussus halophilus]
MAEEHTDDAHRTVKAVDTSLDILEALVEREPMTVTELAETVGRSPSSVHAHLATLRRRKYVVEEDYHYRPGLRYFEIGEKVKENHIGIYRHGTSEAKNLAQEVGEFVWLMVEEHGQAIYVYKTGNERAVETGAYTLGSRWPLHATAAGKVALAHMDEDRVVEILDEYGLEAVTKNTITDRSELLSELETIREEGIAFDDEEAAVGLRAIAAPVHGFDDLIGAISISGPVSRVKAKRFRTELPERLREASNIIGVKYRGATVSTKDLD